jgi:hypothetical protein
MGRLIAPSVPYPIRNPGRPPRTRVSRTPRGAGEIRIPCVRRRLAGLALGLLLAGMALLVLGPFDLGAVRVAGVSLLWWYGGVVGPAAAVLLTIVLLPREPAERK